ncbi:MAG: hypothetical protein ACXAEU_16585 [Candidatus Hodarchaeales archaeon]|jgi:prefoldin subunit 5
MTSNHEQLVKEVEQLKSQVSKLTAEIKHLKENYQALGYIVEDSEATKDELLELERIDNLVKEGKLEGFEELK